MTNEQTVQTEGSKYPTVVEYHHLVTEIGNLNIEKLNIDILLGRMIEKNQAMEANQQALVTEHATAVTNAKLFEEKVINHSTRITELNTENTSLRNKGITVKNETNSKLAEQTEAHDIKVKALEAAIEKLKKPKRTRK